MLNLSVHFTFQIIMEFKNTLEIVTKDIQDIEKLVGNFKNYSAIPNIELDLALSKLRNVYDVLLLFREHHESSTQERKPSVTADSIDSEKDPGINLNDQNNAKISSVLPEERLEAKSPASPALNLEKSGDNIFKTDETSQNEKKVSQPKKTLTKTEKTFSEKFTSEHPFIHEKLGEQTNKSDISSIHQSSPIKTIASSMGINDKFFFIRELFNGDSDLFRLTLDELDQSANFNSAYTILLDKFSWDMESDSVQMLLNLVRRKFISLGNE